MGLWFSDSTNSNWIAYDQDGEQLNNDNTTLQWHTPRVDISQFSGKTLVAVSVHADGYTLPGPWEIYYDKIVIVSQDGTVRPIYTSETSVSSVNQWGTAGVTGQSFEVNHSTGSGAFPTVATTYYHEDHLGTSRLLSSEGGWPIWQGTFLPFGQEWNPQITTNHYKFTGKERDSETGLDYFGARYYGSNMGRWMSPDWADKPEAVPYSDLSNPQSLNLYGYVNDNPLSHADADGHECCDDLLQFAGGVIQGAASSVSFGLVGAPRSSDSNASLAGQLVGTSIVGGTGTSMVSGSGPTALGGLALAPETGGASLVVSAGAVGASALGSEMAAGAAKNVTAIAVAMAAHGNTAGNQPAELYEKTDKDGNLEKHGVSQDASKRYSKAEVGEGKVTVTDRGPRKEMLAKERQKVETNPGPKNKEPWAGKRKDQ